MSTTPKTAVDTTRTGEPGQVATDDHTVGLAGGLGHPGTEAIEIGPHRCRHRHQGVGRTHAHGGEVGHRDHQGLVAHVLEGRESHVEVDAADQEVGGQNGPAARGRGDHGGVVPDPDVTRRRHVTTGSAQPGDGLEPGPQPGNGHELVNRTGALGRLARGIPGIGSSHLPCLALTHTHHS